MTERELLTKMTYDEVYNFLSELIDQTNPIYFDGLTGGVLLLEESKLHKEDVGGRLYVMGEYVQDRLGKLIKIYYGSFNTLYKYSTREIWERELRDVFYHELQHHIEEKARDKTLRNEDKTKIREWKLKQEIV